MKYISTRGKAEELSFEDVATSALASDGGLFVPKDVPFFSVDEISSWKDLSYSELAYKIIAPYVDGEIPADDLRKIIEKSYSTFRNEAIAPLAKLDDNNYILELFHGPTLAFKDFALQFLGNLLDYILEKRSKDVVIIGATSGDTGSAAIEGCRASKHVQLFMLHPYGKVSDVQRKQMTTILSDNIHNLAVEGNFDNCQDMVKDMFNHPDFIGDKHLVAVNSINWVRIMAQIVYYFYAALKVGAPEKEVIFSVPTGNFGDIFAGYMAKKMGLPIAKLIVATNKNDILHRFFKSNDYSQKGVSASLSPSMDIQISSNFERLLFDLYEQDGDEVTNLMDGFKDKGSLKVSDKVLAKAHKLFDSFATNDEETKEVIKQIYTEYGYLCDPHTATGINAALNCDTGNTPVITLATAHPAKFPDAVESASATHPELPAHLSDLFEREEYFTRLSHDIKDVKGYIKGKLSC